MFLKSLEIRGFKSFADKTELKFTKGVTAVVGPNGSGKSNISDSVRWVLGEQSVKTLRGGKMEDVIFAGTQFRKPVGLAQVSLTLNNEDGALASDYNEITISRRIFRSGENEYLINGTKCRLKDITQLFMDTGIGKEGYSLIGQGKIEAILSGKPEDRRALLEEAAGIVKYKSRKEEAEKKLSNTDNNLVRINDILSTYEERLEPLRIEREKALQYNEISNELKEKEVSILVSNIKMLDKTLEDFEKDVNARKLSLEGKRKELLNNKEKLKELEKNIEDLENKTSEDRKLYYEKKNSISVISKDIEVYRERINNLTSYIEKNYLVFEELKSKTEVLQGELKEAKEELEKSLKDKETKDEEINSLENSNKDFIDNIFKIEQEIKALKDEEYELITSSSEISKSISLMEKDLKVKKERNEIAKASIVSTEGNIKINAATIESLDKTLLNNRDEIKLLEEDIVSKKKNIGVFHSKINKKENEIKLKNKSINEMEANKNMLSNLEKHYEGYNRTVKVLMERINKGAVSNAEGTKVIGEIFKVDKKYEVAVEIALGAGISNIITENDKIAKDLIIYLKKNNLGRATFLPLNNIRGNKLNVDEKIKKMSGYLGIASDVVTFSEKYEKAINNMLGRTIVAEDMDSALKISKQSNNSYRIVTLEGEIIAPGGALTGGSIYAKHTNILGRKREIEELGLNITKNKEELEKLSNELEALKLSAKNLDEEILNNRDEIHFKNIENTKLESKISALKNEINRLKYTYDNFKNEITKNNSDIEKINILINEKNKDLTNIDEVKKANDKKALELEESLEKHRSKSETVRNKLTDLKVEKAALDEVLVSKGNEIARISSDIENNALKLKEIEKENAENKEDIRGLEESSIFKKEEIENIEKQLKELESGFTNSEIQKGKLKDEFNKKDSFINESLDIINKEEAELNKKEVLKTRSQVEKENLYNRLNEEMDLTFAEAKEIAVEVQDVTAFKERISVLKRKITSLGVVNLAAIEEYEEIKEKFEFMSGQKEDLEKAKEELFSVINEMTDKMKVLFKENFKILNKNFNETFRDLFKGGSAELILAEGDELSANIDINVEPPGKRLQNINLMSGGEKVLSAIALLFAILKMKPTPFCILDEIEAALDDANVYRYAEFLKEFSKGTQFIVITHRKGTMEASDVMYGVTMEEKGISKVVSVDLNK
ncbi:condensin subunit Smc [Clostridium sp. DSM 8431]|uniref:chromosome segregation protein SMC n=1 Tax=Clostridium sp. DSM 8431 TaxID=1761781 RepID=UPI0008E1F16C|nr:chromosome segregation protein SMC [Clostridium sp. DSM 8431]SFU36783.1 condensin subunit Smc [Clostridium sp. DSM 8431]